MSQHTVITSLPSVLPSYLRAVLKPSGAVLKAGVALPQLSASWKGAKFNREEVERYREVCHLPRGRNEEEMVPLLYPHAMLGPLHMQLFSHELFPIGLIGSVHSRNHVVQYHPLQVDEPFDVEMRLSEGRRRPQGFEIDLTQKISVDGTVAWVSCSTFLARRKLDEAECDAESSLASSVAKIEGKRRCLGRFPISAGTGRAFGLLTRDVNPIHMSKWLARLFGFERDLIHGLWAVARSLPSLSADVDPNQPMRLDCAFKGPLYMERDVAVWGAAPASSDDDLSGAFELYSGSNDRPSVVGRWRNVAAGEVLDVARPPSSSSARRLCSKL